MGSCFPFELDPPPVGRCHSGCTGRTDWTDGRAGPERNPVSLDTVERELARRRAGSAGRGKMPAARVQPLSLDHSSAPAGNRCFTVIREPRFPPRGSRPVNRRPLEEYCKEGRALRVENTINDTRDSRIGKRLKNLPRLRGIGFGAYRSIGPIVPPPPPSRPWQTPSHTGNCVLPGW